jgi:ligand-binding sensor domain-containing protein
LKHGIIQCLYYPLRAGAVIVILFCLPSLVVHGQLPPASFHHLVKDDHLLAYGYHCLAEDRFGFIWFGSWHGGGLYRFDGYDLHSFVVDPQHLENAPKSNHINTLTNCGPDQICIGTHEGLSVVNIITGRFYSPFDSSDLPQPSVFYIEPIQTDSIHRCTWIGATAGLYRIDWSTNHISKLGSDTARVSLGHVIDIQCDKKDSDVLWLGTKTGLIRYSISKDIGQVQTADEEIGVVLDLFQDASGDIWIGADELQRKRPPVVFRLTPASNTWRRFDLLEEGESLIDSLSGAFYIMESTSPGKLWVSTHKRVGLLDTQTGAYVAWRHDVNRPDALLEEGFYRSMLADRHGRLWTTAWNGIQYAKRPFVIPSGRVSQPSVCITQVQFQTAEDETWPLVYQEQLDLNVDQRDITIRYVLPNPLNVNTVSYQYMLSGRDKDWTATDQRAVQYTDLPGGDYIFMIKAREGFGAWTSVTELPITITKKITEYALFWIGIVMLISAVAVGIYRILIARMRREEKVKAAYERRISEIEMEALRSQMNPHFLFNSLNSIKYYAVSRDKNATAEYLSKFALLVRTILNNSRSRTISLKDELDALRLYIEIEHLRLEGKFQYEMEVDSSLYIEQAQIPPMVLQPYVENAIWHGLMHRNGGGVLKVLVKDLGGRIQCIIEDNGIGREKSMQMHEELHTGTESMGMKITEDRIGLVRKIYGIDVRVEVVDLYHDDGTASGTRVIIDIPIIRDTLE